MKKQPTLGQCYPLGANLRPGGVNFSLFSKHATAIELLLFDRAEDARPARVIPLDPRTNRTFYYWHIFVPGLRAGQLYGFRVYGAYVPEEGHRFDSSKVLLDPYSRAVMYGDNYSREAAKRVGYDNCAQAMKSVVVDPRGYDWEEDMPLQRPFSELIVYEMHVGGFTRHPNAGIAPERRGTYAGLIEKIPYLQSLGVTAVELLPVQQFDEQDVPNPILRNYWGYSPVSFFAPHRGYSSQKDPLGPVNEFRELVKALHRAGIEVILDVVFNHTAEGDHAGPTFCYKGLGNRAYYILSDQRAYYDNYSGCGNTFKCNHSIGRRLIMECLHYWVQVMHVDGFRFDLASVMARDEVGRPLESPPILWEIESDPVLAGTKIIAEAWDAAGLYQVGSFVGHRWAEWNARYRDDVRRYLKSDPGTIREVAARIAGSRDIYPALDREPDRSINFVTCHDGFTLNDLVSYNVKHNLANGEDNRDGASDNFSWNCGEEGATNDPEVRALRARQIKNALTLLFISQGTPMLLMGDEVRRTQHGNNNGYCQDNELSWFDWDAVEQEGEFLRFVRGLIRFHRVNQLFRDERFWEDRTQSHPPVVTWHGTKLNKPDWGYHSRSLAFTLHEPLAGEFLHIMLNAYWEPLSFELPPLLPDQRWYRIVDTMLPTPNDFCEPGTKRILNTKQYQVGARAIVILEARLTGPPD